MIDTPASVDGETAPTVGDSAPIVGSEGLLPGVSALPPRIVLNSQGLPAMLQEGQADPEDILIRSAIWPWDDLNAAYTPEQWLRMKRDVFGTVALLSVQTPEGPKLVSSDPLGNLGVKSPPIEVNNFTVPANTDAVQYYDIPDGTSDIWVDIVQPAGGTAVVKTISGFTSFRKYYTNPNLLLPNTDNGIVVKVDNTLDKRIGIEVVGGNYAPGVATVYVSALTMPNQIWVRPVTGEIFTVSPQSGATFPSDVTDRDTRSLGRIGAISRDASVGNIISAPFNVLLPVNGTLTLIAGLLTRTIHVLKLRGAVINTGVQSINLEDDNGIVVDNIRTDFAYPFFMDYDGFALSSGRPLRFRNTSGTTQTATIAGACTAVQI